MSNDPQNQKQPPENEQSIFDRHNYKNAEVRARQIRIAKIIAGAFGVLLILGIIAWLSPIGARFVSQLTAQVQSDLTQATPTPTIDLSSLDVASPTPPPTATTLYGGETFSQTLPTVTPTPENTATAVAIQETQEAAIALGTPEATATVQEGAIFVTVEPTVPPLDTPTPLPTREVVNFTSAGSELPTLDYELDPRCADEPTQAAYVLCVVGLAQTPIEP